MTFRADIRQWPSVAAFEAHLSHYDALRTNYWTQKIVLHHTVRPLPSGWRGIQSMRNLRTYYRDTMRWDSGPHLFVCHGAPDPDDNGIFQLTALNEQATHSNNCNRDGIAIEVVGRYDAVPWPPQLRALVLGTVRALLHWRRLPVSAVVGHRDCGSLKTCPGRAIDLNQVRAAL
jgi:hypothetical protein